jgi:hypothetical protein
LCETKDQIRLFRQDPGQNHFGQKSLEKTPKLGPVEVHPGLGADRAERIGKDRAIEKGGPMAHAKKGAVNGPGDGIGAS